MKVGLLLDNCPIGQSVPDSSIEKLRAMGASAVGLLWTGGTRHGRDVYERCEAALDRPLYLVRVGGHKQTAAEWLREAGAALEAAPARVRDRIGFNFGNEPNLEGWADCPESYGARFVEVNAVFDGVVLFACPSLGVEGWRAWLAAAYAAAGKPRRGIANLYAGNVGLVAELAGLFPEFYVGEVNDLELRGEARRAFLGQSFATLARAGAQAALVFIAGGRSNGAWDERYIVDAGEVAGLGAPPVGDLRAIATGEAQPDTKEGVGLGATIAPAAAPPVTKEGVAVKIGNLEVDDLRAKLPDEPGKMLPVAFTAKDFISIHHTATPRTATPKAIYEHHKRQGWGGIGYNFLIRFDGHVYYVGECNTERAAVGQIEEGNSRGLHVAFIDDLSKQPPADAALASCKALVANLQHAYGWWLPVAPHRLFNSGSKWDTVCPGAQWREWWPSILRAVGE